MNRLYIISLMLIALNNQLLFAQIIQPITIDSSISSNEKEDTITPPEVADIIFSLPKLKQINFGNDSLSDSLVLYSLYANYESSIPFVDDEDVFVSSWNCKTCNKQYLENKNETQASEYTIDTLPYFHNFSYITQKHYFKDTLGDEFCLISFSTSEGYPPCGRYSSGLLSLALFKKDNYWKLENFNPFVNYQGKFNRASTFDTIIDNWIIINGGVANPDIWQVVDSKYVPYYTNLYFIDLKTLTEKLLIEDFNCFSTYKTKGSSWDGKYKINPSNIEILIDGEIDKKNFWGNNLLTEQLKLNKNKFGKKLGRKFRFEIRKTYKNQKNMMKLENNLIELN